MNGYNLIKKKPVLWLTMVAVLMAMNVVLQLLQHPGAGRASLPERHRHLHGGHPAGPAGRVYRGRCRRVPGGFLFYPAPMFVSLASHGLEAVVVSLCAHNLFKEKKALGAGIGVVLGAIIMVIGYTLGRAFVYSTPEYAIIKLPFEILQAGIGAVMGMVLCFSRNLAQRFEKICA